MANRLMIEANIKKERHQEFWRKLKAPTKRKGKTILVRAA